MKKKTPPIFFLTRTQVVDRVGLSRHTLPRMELAGTFPKSFKNGLVRRSYSEKDVTEWQECQMSGRKWAPRDNRT